MMGIMRRGIAGFVGGAVAALMLHVSVGFVVASEAWVGNDNTGEWFFYYTSVNCCLLPFTAAMAWLLSRWARTRVIARGFILGVVVGVLVGPLVALSGYVPPWADDNPVG